MKIAFPVKEESLSSKIDLRFGRASKFMIYDLENQTYEILDNSQNLSAEQGAGIQAAEIIIRSGANHLVCSNCGPKAFRVLNASGIKVYGCSSETVEQALELFKKGELSEQNSANVDGHW
jgi:predicted Fe-Mo cluster-binding NifX family protein